MTAAPSKTRVTLGTQGRIVIPAGIRRHLQLKPGDELIARVENEGLILEKRSAVINRLRDRFAVVPEGRDLTDELIAERRAEAKRENEA